MRPARWLCGPRARPFRSPASLRPPPQAVAVLHQGTAQIAKTALLACAFTVKARILVRRRGVGFVRALGLGEVGLAVAPGGGGSPGPFPAPSPEALLGRKLFIDAQALSKFPSTEKCSPLRSPFTSGRPRKRRETPLRDRVREQAVAVLREGRGVEHLLVDRKPDEPAKQHVELQPFDQLPLRADRIEEAAAARPAASAPAQSKRKPPDPLVKRRKPRVEPSQSRIGSAAASPAADGSPLSAPRRRRKRTTPRSSDPRPASKSPELLMPSVSESQLE